MSSLAGKLSMLVDSYEHSKNTPAYRELKIKYKSLKATNKELMNLLTRLFSEMNTAATTESKNRRDTLKIKKKDVKLQTSCDDEDSEDDCVETIDLTTHVNEDESDEEDECDEDESEDEDNESEDEEDEDIKNQFIAEQEAENAANVQDVDLIVKDMQNIKIKEETIETEDVEEVEVVEEEEVEVVEEEEVEVVEEEIEEVEVIEEEEEIEEVEVVEVVEEETEEVEVVEEEEVEEEEEEEEAGVYEIEVNGTRYYTTSEQNGIVYALIDEDDVGDEIGKFVNGKFILNA
jgi:hypothetical protein